MRKSFVYYFICWVLLAGLFNVICFMVPKTFMEIEIFSDGFWICYAFIMVAFVLHLIFSIFAFSEKNKEKCMANMPVSILSFLELLIMMLGASYLMVKPGIPNWIAIIFCAVILVVSVIVLVLIRGVGENVIDANVELNNKASFYRDTLDVATLICNLTKGTDKSKIAEKIYDAIKYSDSVSSSETAELENMIKQAITNLKENSDKDTESFSKDVDNILNLFEERKVLCMNSKRRK